MAVAVTAPGVSWDDFPGPRHEDEVMTAHAGRPTPAEAVDRGVTPAPAPDHGTDDGVKYAQGGMGWK